MTVKLRSTPRIDHSTLGSEREQNSFLPRTKSKNYTVRLLYYAAAVCMYNAWCILNASDDDRKEKGKHVIALEVKVFVLLAFLIPAKA